MPAIYTLKVLTDFAASHILHGHPGACSRLHGHNWSVEVEIKATVLDHLGMAVDFHDIKKATREICDRLEHRHLNDIPPFDKINPTAENIAAYLYRELGDVLRRPGVQVSAIALWETDRCGVRYTESETL